ncbi:ribosome maturation factor RimM [Cytophagales bacterium WSM2-2]|nr:ribosome maturation factor RimM [Cytophagales bacterium WSM2-2]
MNIEECFKIGYVSKTHGLKGEVTVVFENEFELDDLPIIFLEFNGNLVPHFVEKISDRGDKSFVKFENIDSLEQADSLKGCSIYLSKSNRPKLKRGQFYDDEIIGFAVEDEFAGELGVVNDIQGNGTNRLLVINYNNKEVLVPINSPFVKNVNKSRKTIQLNLPEGYLEV